MIGDAYRLDASKTSVQGALGEMINPKTVRKNSPSGIARISSDTSEAFSSKRISNK